MNAESKLKPESAAMVPPQTEPRPAKPRRKARLALMIAVPLALLLGGGYFWLTGGRYVSTENAYLHQARVEIVSEVAGRVTQSNVADNHTVRKGDVLFQVDPQPYRLALSQAESAVAQARLNVAQMKAAYRQSLSQEAVAKDDVAYLTTQLDRQVALSNRGVSTTVALDKAQHDLSVARERVTTAQQATATALAALGGAPDIATDAHPSVRAALAEKDRASYDLERTIVLAPGDGIVYQAASFRTGQYVSPGTPLFALVETGDTWVDANFKETDLAGIAKGQSATVEFDTHPGDSFNALVEAIGAGTGAEFSLLPAQNATGNWVKVTQRVPVRLRLAGAKPAFDLYSGASATVTIDTQSSARPATRAVN